ncbi:MAG: DUF896 domain-containing protein [Firmicutes bacterium]|nr:DUF896 domain-containing protein [Dethiobacter sp.]MBS3889112.1 DUF896 domain-containing protein [Bacillota bacterium]MBS4054706.1 DUF896 domain-containing protein [Thermaerobacter sp.]
MLSPEKLSRLNALAQKQRADNLTTEEREEQRQLREEYLVNFRGRFTAELENLGLTKIEQPTCPCCAGKHQH